MDNNPDSTDSSEIGIFIERSWYNEKHRGV